VPPPQPRARCERAQLRRREETRPVIPGTRRHVGRRDVRPVEHPPAGGRPVVRAGGLLYRSTAERPAAGRVLLPR
jgi:hypothetical protein